jgi:Ser-tRNA(Ala) deacylase AlaX
MEKIFWNNPYQRTLNTIVTFVEGNEILLAQTIAYSFSGGQESDKAFLNDIEIIGSRMEGKLIYYKVPDNHNFSVGDKVIMTIDWSRRYKLMRLHFAAELILELVTKNFRFEKVGAHISESKARIDFKCEYNISSVFDIILDEYNHIIQSDKLIQTGFSNIESQRRFWKIDGFAEVPCGGTHVKSTAEVGFVSLKRSHPGKGIERIEIKLINENEGITGSYA